MSEVRALQDVGQFTASMDELREILAIAPDLPEATYRLGVALVQTGEPSRAVWALEKASESEEYAIPAGLLLASAHFSAQNFEATVRAADRVLERDPERLVALRLRAKANLGAGDLDQALADTERLLEIYPDDYSVRVLHATVLADLGQLDEAKEAHDLIKQIGLDSGDPSLANRSCLAPAMFARDHTEDNDAAEALYDDCVELYPTNAFVARESMKFYDKIGKPEKSTSLIRKAVEEAPENLSLRANLSGRLRSQGDVAGAEEVLKEAVDSFRSAGAWNLLSNFYRNQDESEKALEALEKVMELTGGGNDQMRFTQADVLIDLDRIEEADKIADELIEPTYATLLRGRIALERGDPAGAQALFDKGIRAWPNNSGARFLAGLAAVELGQFDRAMSELRESVRADKTANEAAHLLARLHFQRGEYRDAVRFTKIASARPGADRGNVSVIAIRAFSELDEHVNARALATGLMQMQGKQQLGLIELSTVERKASGPEAAVRTILGGPLDLKDPENFEVLRALVDHQIAAGQTADALERVDAAIGRAPDSAAAHALRGHTLWILGRGEEASAAFNRATELDAELAAAYAGLATVAAGTGDLAQAAELFDKAATLKPETSTFLYSAAQLRLASGDTEGAEERLREVVRQAPGHVGARNDLAWILAEREEDLDLALALAKEANRLEPSADVLDTLGWVRFKRGEATAAVNALEQAVEARSDSPSIRYRLGVALRKAGDEERAREMLKAAVASGSFPEAADAERELAQLAQP